MKKQTKVKPNVPKKKVKPKKSPSIEGIRADYLFNRECMLEDFANALEEVRRDVPSLPGNIAGMDYKQVSTRSIFLMIKEQESYTTNNQPAYIDAAEEAVILADMVKRTKAVLKNYDVWYEQASI